MIKTLVVDDSVLFRSQIKKALSGQGRINLAGFAQNGRIAIDLLKSGAWDLVLLDLEMPELSGIETLKLIQKLDNPPKVLVFSSFSKKGADVTFEALSLGASDFAAKPSSETPEEPHLAIRSLLIPKIEALFPGTESSRTAVSNIDGQNLSTDLTGVENWPLELPEVIVIASSTGGPNALDEVFHQVKAPLNIPVLIVQHMPPIFTASLAEKIGKLTGVPSAEARNFEQVTANRIYVAPGDFHLYVKIINSRRTLLLDQGPQMHSIRPAADHLFTTAVESYGRKVLGIVLTGMGYDGRLGAKKIKASGGGVVIQEKDTCVVWGMPAGAFEDKSYDKILNPKDIGKLIQNLSERALGGRL
ncbi:MAG: chemotaxis-specific protein-glutamate methyltransferase CheB [Pseudobdellovibrionaceae bacterium]